jgi:bifunctional oligoribonuclease and PAP phosphatase NrnA
MINKNVITAARNRILKSERVMVASHIRPDGDAVGSLLGIGLALEAAGKNVQMILLDGVPEEFSFLSGCEKIKKDWQDPVDLTIVVDSSELIRVGNVFSTGQIPDLNIDHHITNRGFAHINLIDPEAAATAEILYNVLPELSLPSTPAVNNALLTGILTDTIGFRTSSVTPDTLRSAAALMEQGADLVNVYKNALSSRSLAALRYWGKGLENLVYEDGLVWTTLTIDARNQSGYNGRDDADLINALSTLHEVYVAVVFVEQTDGAVKISWRAQNGYDVSSLAEELGGGGHRAASGTEIKGSLQEVQDIVLEKTRRILVKKRA